VHPDVSSVCTKCKGLPGISCTALQHSILSWSCAGAVQAKRPGNHQQQHSNSRLWPLLLQVLGAAEYVFTALFTAECVLRAVANNFFFGPEAYLKTAWSWLDLGCVIISLVSLAPMSGGSQSLSSLRALRALRPLCTIQSIPGVLGHAVQPPGEPFFLLQLLLQAPILA
jgi:hypothetical protein